MTRVLVCGASVIDDASFIHRTLTEVNRVYGPISCVIHSNHQPALAWQQWISRKQVTKHLPIVPNWDDGVAVHDRHHDRLFKEGRPDLVVVFDVIDRKEPNFDPTEKRRVSELIAHRALDRGLEVLTFTYDLLEQRANKAAAKAAASRPTALAAE